MSTHPVTFPGFECVQISAAEWWRGCNPRFVGTRVLWDDGTAHQTPQDNREHITVLCKRTHHRKGPTP